MSQHKVQSSYPLCPSITAFYKCPKCTAATHHKEQKKMFIRQYRCGTDSTAKFMAAKSLNVNVIITIIIYIDSDIRYRYYNRVDIMVCF